MEQLQKILSFILKLNGFMTKLLVSILVKFGMSEDDLYESMTLLVKKILLLRIDLEVIGEENIPDKGPRLIIFNHVNGLDAFVMPPSIPFIMNGWVANRHIDLPFVSFYHAVKRAYPIKRGLRDKGAMKWMISSIDNGGIGAIAPGGTRDQTGILTPQDDVKYGAGFIAVKTNATVIPAGINGTKNGMKRFLNPFGPRLKVTVKIGVPFKVSDYQDYLKLDIGNNETKSMFQKVSVEMMHHIAPLLEDWMQGEYSN